MKKQFFFSMFAAAAMLVSCSSEDAVVDKVDTTAGGYMAVSINLPTTSGSSTRALNDQLDHGQNWEYDVQDVYLLLLGGADEASATVQGIYNITGAAFTPTDQTSNVTVRTKYVTKVDNLTGTYAYAYVLMNYGSAAVFNNGNLNLNGVNLLGKTISDVQAIQNITAQTLKSNYIPMSNSPIQAKPGADLNPNGAYTTLSAVNKSYIYNTEAAATAGSAATEVYVERAAAKVTLSAATTDPFTLTDETLPLGGAIYGQVIGYIVDNTNKTYSPARETASFSTWGSISSPNPAFASTDKLYRFVGKAKIDDAGYRSYWAQDKNYSTYNSADFYRYAYTTFNVNGTKAKYFPENTFDVDNQVWKQTTRVVLKVAIGTSITAGKVNYEPFWLSNPTNTDTKAAIFTETSLLAKIKNVVFTKLVADGVADPSGSESDVAVANYKTNAGKVVPTATYSGLLMAGKTSADVAVSAAAAINTCDELYNLTYFIDGTCYYQVRIKHFGDELTPWNTWETSDQPSAATIYNGANAGEIAARYLGRFGVLRNNWYEVDVTGISRIGFATVPSVKGPGDPDPYKPTDPQATDDPNDPNNPDTPGYDPNNPSVDPWEPDPTWPVDPGTTPGVDPREPITPPGNTPDDEIDSYIAAKINVLSWAKRLQHVTL